MNKQKGFSTILGIIILFVIGIGIYVYLNNNSDNISKLRISGCELDYKCDDTNSLGEFELARCEIKDNNQISQASSIRIQNTFITEWDNRHPSIKEISQEVICSRNPNDFRSFFIGTMRRYSSKNDIWSKQDLLNEESRLLSVITNESENVELRAEILDELSRIYYYLDFSGEEAENIFSVASELLNKNNEMSAYAKSTLSGALASIDAQRSQSILGIE